MSDVPSEVAIEICQLITKNVPYTVEEIIQLLPNYTREQIKEGMDELVEHDVLTKFPNVLVTQAPIITDFSLN